jgi:hypothetical protein
MKLDHSNPFHQSAFYLERLERTITHDSSKALRGIKNKDADVLLTMLLHDIGFTMSADELREAAEHYSANWQRLTEGPPTLVRSIYLDGLLQGMAFAAKLTSSCPNCYPDAS